jgi:hypothetical protein
MKEFLPRSAAQDGAASERPTTFASAHFLHLSGKNFCLHASRSI